MTLGLGEAPAQRETACQPGVQEYSVLAPQRSFLPQIPTALANSRSTRNRWLQQTRRRAAILANARQLVMEEGYQHVAMCRLAERSGVTPPTIYNLIGGREEVLHRAVKEVHAAKIAFAKKRADAEGINGVLTYADTFWVALSLDPEYSRQVIYAMTLVDHDLSLIIRREAVSAILGWLTSLETRQHLGRRVDLPLVAEVIHRHITSVIGAWAKGDMGLLDLRSQLVVGIGLILLGMADRTESIRIERWLAGLGLGDLSDQSDT